MKSKIVNDCYEQTYNDKLCLKNINFESTKSSVSLFRIDSNPNIISVLKTDMIKIITDDIECDTFGIVGNLILNMCRHDDIYMPLDLILCFYQYVADITYDTIEEKIKHAFDLKFRSIPRYIHHINCSRIWFSSSIINKYDYYNIAGLSYKSLNINHCTIKYDIFVKENENQNNYVMRIHKYKNNI